MINYKFLLFLTLFWGASINASDNLSDAIKDINANVIFMRHTLAPGYGDPDNFSINDCSTQRNLSAKGIDQARRIGIFFRKSNVQFSDILSSQWCRCKDTAENLNIGNWEEFSGLNSFFEEHADRDNTLNLLYQKINNLPNDKITLMVTHQVVISAVTNIYTQSGGIVLYNSRNKKSKLFNMENISTYE